MTEQTLDERVIEWLADHLTVPRPKIAFTTRVGEDLGVDGDDAEELLRAYSEKFGVDCKGFDFKRYFGPEAGPNIFGIVLTWLGVSSHPKLASLTVARLIDGARRGSLHG